MVAAVRTSLYVELMGSRKDPELIAKFLFVVRGWFRCSHVCLVNEQRKSLVHVSLKLGKWTLISLRKYGKTKTNSRNSVTGCPFFTRIDNSLLIL